MGLVVFGQTVPLRAQEASSSKARILSSIPYREVQDPERSKDIEGRCRLTLYLPDKLDAYDESCRTFPDLPT